MNEPISLLLDAWRQCDKHLHHLQHAIDSLQPYLPATANFIASMDDERVQDWDQFILRFSKLQDTMGMRLYPAVLAYLEEPFETRPMLDKLYRLEQLGLLMSVEMWQQLRAIRNRFAHDYPEEDALKAAYLNEAVNSVQIMKDLLGRIKPLVQ
jgi:hypothetical protein